MRRKIDLLDEATLFAVSVRLQSVASDLKKIIDGQEAEIKHFEWTGSLVSQMDWNSKYHNRNPELCVIATKLRSQFYSTLSRYGISSRDQFSDRLYEILKSPTDIQPEDKNLELAYNIIRSMATKILNELH